MNGGLFTCNLEIHPDDRFTWIIPSRADTVI